jgi:hypothetical protein
MLEPTHLQITLVSSGRFQKPTCKSDDFRCWKKFKAAGIRCESEWHIIVHGSYCLFDFPTRVVFAFASNEWLSWVSDLFANAMYTMSARLTGVHCKSLSVIETETSRLHAKTTIVSSRLRRVLS